MSESWDGINWKCLKCGRTFNVLEVDNYRCPECRDQVEVRDFRKRALRLDCGFQKLRINGGYKGLGCQLTTYGIGAGDAVVGLIDHSVGVSPCIIQKCPMYQTWQLLEKQEKVG